MGLVLMYKKKSLLFLKKKFWKYTK